MISQQRVQDTFDKYIKPCSTLINIEDFVDLAGAKITYFLTDEATNDSQPCYGVGVVTEIGLSPSEEKLLLFIQTTVGTLIPPCGQEDSWSIFWNNEVLQDPQNIEKIVFRAV